ncbi:hypothetical protein ABIE44_001696 [Marmoricola sp. OAE513]
MKVPVPTRKLVSSVHSSSEPVHQWMASGWVSSAISETQARMSSRVVGAVVLVGAVAVMPVFLSIAIRTHGDVAGPAAERIDGS